MAEVVSPLRGYDLFSCTFVDPRADALGYTLTPPSEAQDGFTDASFGGSGRLHLRLLRRLRTASQTPPSEAQDGFTDAPFGGPGRLHRRPLWRLRMASLTSPSEAQ